MAGGTGGCRHVNLRCHQWRRGWRRGGSQNSVAYWLIDVRLWLNKQCNWGPGDTVKTLLMPALLWLVAPGVVALTTYGVISGGVVGVGLWHGLFCVCNCHLFMDYTVDTLLMMLLRIIVCVIKWINKQGNKGHHAKLYVAICLQIGWMDQTFWGWLCGLERVYNAFHVHCWACISQDCIIHPFDEFFVYVLFQLCLSSYLNNCSQFKVNFV